MNLNDLRTRIEGLGLPGVTGIALLVFACALYASALRPLQQQVSELRDEAAQLQSKQKLNGTLRISSPDEQLEHFYNFFPATQSTPDWLGKIHTAAKDNGVELASGEYKLERGSGDKLARYQIVLPLKGSYQQIRGFIAKVLELVPAAALNEISLQRDSVGNSQLEARIRLTLYLGGTA